MNRPVIVGATRMLGGHALEHPDVERVISHSKAAIRTARKPEPGAAHTAAPASAVKAASESM
jgi:hypothetical protein